MSEANPTTAIDSLVGKAYTWKGQTFHAKMLLFVALERAGIPTATLRDNSLSATLVGIYALTQPAKKVWLGMQTNTILRDATLFGDTLQPGEIEEAAQIVGDVVQRYFDSVATYAAANSGGEEKNDQAAADK